MANSTIFHDSLLKHGIKGIDDLPLGCALCVATLVQCYSTSAVSKSTQESTFGDFTPGRYAWEFGNVRLFARPFPCAGQQGVWQWRGFLPQLAKVEVAP